MSTRPPISIETLKEYLYLDDEGVFRWKNTRGPAKANMIAGTLKKDGQRIICLLGKRYYSTELLNLWLTGTWKKKSRNIRPVIGKVPFRGVLSNQAGRYLAIYNRAGIKRYLGTFDTPEAASRQYEAFAELVSIGAYVDTLPIVRTYSPVEGNSGEKEIFASIHLEAFNK